MADEALTMLVNILAIYNFIFAFFIVFFEKRSPASTWAWLMVVLLVPYVGSLLYLLLGFGTRKHRTFRIKASMDDEYSKKLRSMKLGGLSCFEGQDKIMSGKNILNKNDCEHLDDLVRLNYLSGDGALTKNNTIKAYFEGSDKFSALFDDIRGARDFVHLQYYILRNDRLGQRLIDVLAEKAAEGVEVRLLVDGMGTSFVPKAFYKKMLGAGGKLAVFMPPRFIRINFRNHRKIAVIDGKIGYIGGLNIGDEYLGLKKRFGHWRDTHLRIEGDSCKDLERRFLLDWNYCSGDKIEPGPRYFPVIIPDLTPEARSLPVQIVSSGPDTKWPSIHQSYLKMMMEADESIYIATPYFIPDDSMLECLKIAALAGIDVRIVIPQNPDHLFVYWASTSYLSELLRAGVKCYEYTNGFIHSKLLIIDNKFASVGTANMDVRSFKLNFEINAFIFDEETSALLTKQFFCDLNDCEVFDMDKIQKRSFIEKIKEAFSRLISPLL